MDIEVNFSKADKSFAAEVSADERSHEVNAAGELVFYVPDKGYLKKEDADQYYQAKGEYLEASALEGAINDALREAKESGQFDGKPGYTPVKGKDYFDGEPGYSPVKGKDYFDGAPGRTPEKGVDYWTSNDIEEMVAATVAALPKYNGEVIEL